MRANKLFIFGLLALAACTQQPAVALDASNPIHCMAAFNVTAVIGKQAGNSKLQLESIARALFESEKLGSRRAIDDAKLETMKLAQDRLAQDGDATQSLAVECAKKQDADPAFEARVPDLLVKSQEWDPSA